MHLGQSRSKTGIWGEKWWVPERNPKNRVPCSGATRQASLWLAGGELLGLAPLF